MYLISAISINNSVGVNEPLPQPIERPFFEIALIVRKILEVVGEQFKNISYSLYKLIENYQFIFPFSVLLEDRIKIVKCFQYLEEAKALREINPSANASHFMQACVALSLLEVQNLPYHIHYSIYLFLISKDCIKSAENVQYLKNQVLRMYYYGSHGVQPKEKYRAALSIVGWLNEMNLKQDASTFFCNFLNELMNSHLTSHQKIQLLVDFASYKSEDFLNEYKKALLDSAVSLLPKVKENIPVR